MKTIINLVNCLQLLPWSETGYFESSSGRKKIVLFNNDERKSDGDTIYGSKTISCQSDTCLATLSTVKMRNRLSFQCKIEQLTDTTVLEVPLRRTVFPHMANFVLRHLKDLDVNTKISLFGIATWRSCISSLHIRGSCTYSVIAECH